MNFKKIEDYSILKEKINQRFFNQKELIDLYRYNYSLMIDGNTDLHYRLEYYKICILILEHLLLIREDKSSCRLDLLNCLYYGYLNFNLLSNKEVISSYFIDNYNLCREILAKHTITVNELKEITSLKFEYTIYEKVMNLSKHEDLKSNFTELIQFNLKDKKVVDGDTQ